MKSRFSILLVSLVFLSVGCSSISVHHDFDREADFVKYKTFAWIQQPTMAVGDAKAAQRLNTLLDKRIRSAVNAQLTGKGLREDSENPDLFLAYHTGLEDRVDVTDWGYTYPHRYGGWYGGGSDISVTHYQQGTLIVDLIDTESKQLVWRGTATKTLESDPSPERQEKNINDAVAKIFAAYPPTK